MSQKNSQNSNSTPKPYPEADSSQQIGQVAETASTAYAVRTDAKWKPPARTIAGLAADDEVWAFVKVNDLLPHLETAIQLARGTFSDVREMWLSYEPDPEIPKFNSIGIWVKAAGTPEELFEQYKKYVNLFTHDVPSEYRHQIGILVGVA